MASAGVMVVRFIEIGWHQADCIKAVLEWCLTKFGDFGYGIPGIGGSGSLESARMLRETLGVQLLPK